ncbi:MAG: biotin/lipoyl-containing protein [Rhizobiaceae bacterium]
MPHDIIMPALGMAQDSGVILRWLKAPGDEVVEGDALFEVETDKATMEVEAQSAGWLADVRAAAGAEVPVGEVIAVIADTPDLATPPPANEEAPPADNGEEPAEATASAQMPEGVRVIMPALGMSQDTGSIVSWLKAPGDAVAEDDILLEVETDKSTMEVPAGASGYVAGLLAEAGQEVPVGDVIAVISAEKPANPTQIRAAAKPGLIHETAEPRATAPVPPASPKTAAAEPAHQHAPAGSVAPWTGRIFASPRARRLAAEAGLDLARLAAAGHPQPYHAADIETLRNMPVESASSVTSVGARQVSARAAAEPGRALLDWLLQAEGLALPASQLWLRFAAAALRQARQAEGELVVELASIGAATTRTRNPDRTGLATDPETAEEAHPDLILRDLSASAITGLRLGAVQAPALSILAEGDALAITLDFDPAQLDDSTAIKLVAGFAERLNDPLTQLL